jgi:hypothetical protein
MCPFERFLCSSLIGGLLSILLYTRFEREVFLHQAIFSPFCEPLQAARATLQLPWLLRFEAFTTKSPLC